MKALLICVFLAIAGLLLWALSDGIGWRTPEGVEIALNYDYKLKIDRISPERPFSSDVMEFAKDDGARFNPGVYKLQRVSITVERPPGQHGWTGRYE